MKILGYTNFKKKSQKREFSLGNIGETPKIENCLTQLWFNIWSLQRWNFSKVQKESPTFSVLKKIPSKFRGGVIIENLGPYQFWNFEKICLCYLRKIPIFDSFFKIDVAPNFQ